MKQNIRNWYIEKYPTCEMGEFIRPEITFSDCFVALDTYKDFYAVIGVIDSIVRERVFSKLAELMEVDYNYIYNQWLLA